MEFCWLDVASEEAKLNKIKESALRAEKNGFSPKYWQAEAIDERFYPEIRKKDRPLARPPTELAFATGVTESFVPGFELLLASMLEFMPGLDNVVYAFHDGIGSFSMERILAAYENVVFVESDMAKMDPLPASSTDQKRTGVFGYMSAEALRMDHELMVILDSDMILQGGVADLWESCGSYRLAPYCDSRPYAPVSNYTKRPVLNSSLVVVPKKEMGEKKYQDFKNALKDNCIRDVCSHLDRFSSQKIWNVFLRDKEVEILNMNMNSSPRYIAAFHGGETNDVSVLHFSGKKPWLGEVDVDEKVRWGANIWNAYRSSRIF